MTTISVAILVGSDSDLPVVASAVKILDEFSLRHCINVASAHRTPEKLRACIRTAEQQGAEVFIAAAGMAAALPGVVASETVRPVIGIPLEGRSLSGLDALLSVVQMPPGIPVATVAIGSAGATNAALLAVEILAVKKPALRRKLKAYRDKLASAVAEKDAKLQRLGISNYIEQQVKK